MPGDERREAGEEEEPPGYKINLNLDLFALLFAFPLDKHTVKTIDPSIYDGFSFFPDLMEAFHLWY